jgi:hypothetical protein
MILTRSADGVRDRRASVTARDLFTRATVWTARHLPSEALAVLRERRPADDDPYLESHITIDQLAGRVRTLERQRWLYDTLFYKAFSTAGLGDYLEFGVFQGASLCAAYRAAFELYRQLSVDAEWGNLGGQIETGRVQWAAARFIGFDSFKGIPAIRGPDAERPFYVEGEWAASEEQAWAAVDSEGIDRAKVRLVGGFFEDSCTPETAERLGLSEVAVVHIDSDIYESARVALAFCTPYLRDGSVVIFDEWFQYHANPNYGEQRAFGEWRAAHPDWQVAELGREPVGRMAFVLTPPGA